MLVSLHQDAFEDDEYEDEANAKQLMEGHISEKAEAAIQNSMMAKLKEQAKTMEKKPIGFEEMEDVRERTLDVDSDSSVSFM